MDIVAKARFVRLSASKAVDLARALRGLRAQEALDKLSASRRKGAVLIRQVLRSAIANAKNNADLPVERLYVREAVVEQGPSLKRYWPRSRGMVSPILRRMSHIRIVLTDENPRAK